MRFKVQNQKDIHLSQDKQTDVSINTPTLKKRRPFTFTSLNDNDYLEFIIKIYDSNDGARELGN
jgi:hypothetical protein